MPYQSQAQQRLFNAKARQGNPKFIKLARDFNQATYGRPGLNKSGKPIHPDIKAAARKRGQRRYGALPAHSVGRQTPTGSRTGGS